MKKLILSLAIASCFYSNAQTLLSENFEGTTFPPTGWTSSSTEATRPWGLPTILFPGTSTANTNLRTTFTIAGSNSAAIHWFDGPNDAHLTTPSFSLAGTTNPILKFKVKVGWTYMISQNAGDLIAKISTDGGTTWTNIWNEDSQPGWADDGDNNTETDNYETVPVQINLTQYAGQANVKIRFQYIADNADGVSIDDVQVLPNGTLGTSETSKAKTSTAIYPNPTKGEINIKTDKKIKSTSVIDMTGKTLNRAESGNTDISALPKGTYLMKVEFADGTSTTEKIIKQ